MKQKTKTWTYRKIEPWMGRSHRANKGTDLMTGLLRKLAMTETTESWKTMEPWIASFLAMTETKKLWNTSLSSSLYSSSPPAPLPHRNPYESRVFRWGVRSSRPWMLQRSVMSIGTPKITNNKWSNVPDCHITSLLAITETNKNSGLPRFVRNDWNVTIPEKDLYSEEEWP